MNAGDTLEPKTFTVTRADLVAYAEASGDHNPIHQDEQVARSVGLPGVIAHGMYTLALAARAVADWFPDHEVVSLGCKFTAPVASVTSLVVPMMSLPPIWRSEVTVSVAVSSSPSTTGRS